MKRRRRPPALLLALLPAMAALPAARAQGPLEEAVAILDGDAPDEEAAAALARAGFEPRRLAARLETWTPAGPAPAVGAWRADLTASDGRATDLWVYVPEAYRPGKPWPLWVLLHGRGGDGRQMVDLCRAAADRWGALVVAPSAKPFPGMLPIHPHWWKSTADGFPLAALRWARTRFHVDDDRVLLLGYSMGAFGAWNVGLRFPDAFHALAAFAGGISQIEYAGRPDERRRALLANASLVRCFFAHGSADPVVPVRFSRDIRKALLASGARFTYWEIAGGGHLLEPILAAGRGDFVTGWVARDLFDELADLRRPGPGGRFAFTALEAPSRVRSVAVRKADAFPCRVEARWEGSAVRLGTENVARLSVLFDRALLPEDGEVRVVVDGREAFSGTLAPSLAVLVRSWRETRDRRRLFLAAVTVDPGAETEEGF